MWGCYCFIPQSLRNFKIIYQDHSLQDLKSDLKTKRYLNSLIEKTEGVIVVSEEQKKFFPTAKRFFLLENIVRKPSIKISAIPKDKKMVAVGNFRKIKNYSFLLEILQLLPQEYSCDIYTNHIEKNYFDENKEIIESLIAQKRLKIIQGERNIQKCLVNYSMAIHTSLSESGPLVAVECLSVGLPLLMYNTGAVAKHIQNSIPDLIKGNTNSDEWVRTILDYHGDRVRMETYSATLYQLYLDIYSEENYFSKCLKIYERIQNS